MFSLKWRTCAISDFLYVCLDDREEHLVVLVTVLVLLKKCMEYEVDGSRSRGRPKRTCKEVMQKDCQARNWNKEDAMDRGRWKTVIKIG